MGKLTDKRNEFDRLDKRLLSLKNIKPAFIEEYEILERKNIEIYDLYCEKFQNLSYLQSAMGKYRVLEHEKEMKTKKRLKSVQQRLRDQEMTMMRNDHDGVDDLDICEANNQSSRRRQQFGSSMTPSMSHTNTNTNSQSASSGVTSTGSSSMTSPQRSMTGSHDDGSIGSISDIDDEHLQF